MKISPSVLMVLACGLASCAQHEPQPQLASRAAGLSVAQVLEKDLAIAFHLGDTGLVGAAEPLPAGGALLPETFYKQIESAFDGTAAEGALQEENERSDWKVVAARVSPCSALGAVPSSDTAVLCWPEVRLVFQPILYKVRIHERFSPAFADDRALHVLYDVPFELALTAPEAARARSLVERTRALAEGKAVAPLTGPERAEFVALRDRATTRLLEDTLALREPGYPSQRYAGLGLRPESLEGTAGAGMRQRLLAFFGTYARASWIRELTAFSLPAGREPAHLDQWVFLAFKGAATQLVPVDLTLRSARDGALLFNYGRSMEASMSSDDPRPWDELEGPRGDEIRDSVILGTADIARLAGPIADRRERLVPNVPCGSCHKLNELRFDFHNLGYLEDRDLTIAPRVKVDVQRDLEWLRDSFVPRRAEQRSGG